MNYLEFKLLLQDAEDEAINRGIDVDVCDILIKSPNEIPTRITLVHIQKVEVSAHPLKGE